MLHEAATIQTHFAFCFVKEAIWSQEEDGESGRMENKDANRTNRFFLKAKSMRWKWCGCSDRNATPSVFFSRITSNKDHRAIVYTTTVQFNYTIKLSGFHKAFGNPNINHSTFCFIRDQAMGSRSMPGMGRWREIQVNRPKAFFLWNKSII